MIAIVTKQLVQACDELQSLAPLRVIRSEQEYDRAIEVLNELLDTVGDDETHPLYELLDTLSTLIQNYEESHYPSPVTVGSNVLRFLMEEHELAPGDLPEIGDAQAVEELLTDKRELRVGDVQRLAMRFGVSPATFLG
jgi:HTH-type transcriptional regulator / antitoxin HigA